MVKRITKRISSGGGGVAHAGMGSGLTMRITVRDGRIALARPDAPTVPPQSPLAAVPCPPSLPFTNGGHGKKIAKKTTSTAARSTTTTTTASTKHERSLSDGALSTTSARGVVDSWIRNGSMLKLGHSSTGPARVVYIKFGRPADDPESLARVMVALQGRCDSESARFGGIHIRSPVAHLVQLPKHVWAWMQGYRTKNRLDETDRFALTRPLVEAVERGLHVLIGERPPSSMPDELADYVRRRKAIIDTCIMNNPIYKRLLDAVAREPSRSCIPSSSASHSVSMPQLSAILSGMKL